MINKPPPLNRDYDRDPNIKALKRRGFLNHGSTLDLGSQKSPCARCMGLEDGDEAMPPEPH